MRIDTVVFAQVRDDLHTLAGKTKELIYVHPAFLDFLTRVTGGEPRVTTVAMNGELVGALPFLIREHTGVGVMINSLPWWGSHGSCVLDRQRPDADDIRRALLVGYRSQIERADLISATMILSHEEEARRALYVAALSPAATDARIGQITELPHDPGEGGNSLLHVFEQKTRNLVRKSLKQGFAEHVDDDDRAWSFLHRVHVENISALGGKPKPLSHFQALREALPPPVRRLSLAMDGDTPVAALLLLYGGRTVEYVTPAIETSARSRQPLSFLIWNGMLDAIKRGFTAWNWGGTWAGQSSLHHFKAGFGAQDRPYSYLICAPPEGTAKLRKYRRELDTMFPYFYAYPFSLLDARADPA